MVRNYLGTCLSTILILVLAPDWCFANPFKVLYVINGDTITVAQNGSESTIRLAGIDAPELPIKTHQIGQPFSQKSKEYLEEMVLSKNVAIVSYGKDRYGRRLGVVFADGKNVNLEMIKAGLAEVYRGKPIQGFDNSPYRWAESEARKALLGIWELRDQYFSPKDWREIYKN